MKKLAALLLAAVALVAGPSPAETLTGKALIRERIALPDGLIFEAVIEDISRADAPAECLAATRLETRGQPPFSFEIDYDPASLSPQGQYALRATLHRDGALFATTDRIVRVLQDGTPAPVEVVMRLVPQRKAEAAPPLPAHGLRLPATFRGTLPCADCEGIRHHLDLWPDQVFHLSREWLGHADGPLRRDAVGRWSADPVRGAILLYGASEEPLTWQVMAPDRLRLMDMQGDPILSDLDYDLTAKAGLEPTNLEALSLSGEVVVGPEGPGFRDCLTGRVYPITADGDLPALLTAVEAQRIDPETPLLVSLAARITQPSPGGAPAFPTLTVLHFDRAFPGESCTLPEPVARLTNTYWRITGLLGQSVPRPPNTREPHLILQDIEGDRYVATVGCNRLLGGYKLAGEGLTLAAGATTLMACPSPLDLAEQHLRDALERTRAYRLAGQRLELLDAEGAVLAELEAVYLR